VFAVFAFGGLLLRRGALVARTLDSFDFKARRGLLGFAHSR
jgi:hypothetical protein